MEGQRQLAVRQQALQKETEGVKPILSLFPSFPLFPPSLSSYKINQVINKAATIRQGADTWWQQPAQYIVPWITVDGKSLEEFIHEWRSLCAVLEIK